VTAVYSVDGCVIFDMVYVYVGPVSTAFIKSATPQSSGIYTTRFNTVCLTILGPEMTIYNTHTHIRLWPSRLCLELPGELVPEPIWILLKQETASGSGISWAMCRSALCPRHSHTSIPPLSVFTGRMPFLPPNQQRQNTEG